MSYAAIDIGSNAIRLVISTEPQGKSSILLLKQRLPIRLGADVFFNGKISKKNLDQIVVIFKTFYKKMIEHKVTSYLAVATSAFREASNKGVVIQEIFRKTNIKVQIIDGATEARFIYQAVHHKMGKLPNHCLLVDIGGGSFEVTFVKNNQPKSSKSFAIGTVRLLEILKKRKLKENQLPFLLLEHFAEVYTFIRDNKSKSSSPLFLIGTGGNVEAMGKLHRSFLQSKASKNLFKTDLDLLYNKVSQFTLKERVDKLQLRKDRADVIIPAILIIKLLMILSDASEFMIPHAGLKDGLLLALMQKDSRNLKNQKQGNIRSDRQGSSLLYPATQVHLIRNL